MAADPFKYFRVEARELVAELGKGVLDLEKGPPEADLISRLLRLAHTLKGAARVVRQPAIAEIAHALEDILTEIRKGEVAAPREQIDAMLTKLDEIDRRVGALATPAPTPTSPASEVGAAPVPASPTKSAPEEHFRTVRADIGEMDTLLEGMAEAHVQLTALHRSLGELGRSSHLAELLSVQLRSAQRGPRNDPSSKASALAEELSDQLTAMRITVERHVEEIDRELRQVRAGAERLRLIPVALVFNALERIARDVAQSTGKQVTLAAFGGDVRLDAPVLEVMQGALVQIVRNAVAHGIEPESKRIAAGKPAVGRLVVDVRRRGNRVAFVCRDDGAGIDVAAVRRAAAQRGAIAPDAKLDAGELVQLLFKGGISTSESVTGVSGRGVGLDVVREAASRLGGEVHVETEPGRGTMFELVVPVSLASLDALRVEAGPHAAVIPLEAVRRTLRVSADEIAKTAEGDSIVLDGKIVPFAPLLRTLRREPAAEPVAVWSAVVIESAGRFAAIGVDRLLGTENVVLRPLPDLTPADPVVAGATLDAEGNPQIVLDPDALVTQARRVHAVIPAAPAERRPILVVDDSLTTRMLEQSILESAGYEVDLAVSGEEGLEKALRRRYALILVDVEMPGINGFEFIENLRGDPHLRDIPAILVTSRNAPEDRERGEEVGADGYIVKSDFEQNELLERIRRLVE